MSSRRGSAPSAPTPPGSSGHRSWSRSPARGSRHPRRRSSDCRSTRSRPGPDCSSHRNRHIAATGRQTYSASSSTRRETPPVVPPPRTSRRSPAATRLSEGDVGSERPLDACLGRLLDLDHVGAVRQRRARNEQHRFIAVEDRCSGGSVHRVRGVVGTSVYDTQTAAGGRFRSCRARQSCGQPTGRRLCQQRDQRQTHAHALPPARLQRIGELTVVREREGGGGARTREQDRRRRGGLLGSRALEHIEAGVARRIVGERDLCQLGAQHPDGMKRSRQHSSIAWTSLTAAPRSRSLSPASVAPEGV